MRRVEDAHREGARQEWATPRALFEVLHEEFRFSVDACALPYNAKLPRFWTPREDGLAQVWEGERVFCNPPYKAIEKWLVRGAEAVARDGRTVAVYLLPARTDSAWFEAFSPVARVEFFRGRISFESLDVRASSNAEGSLLLVLGASVPAGTFGLRDAKSGRARRSARPALVWSVPCL